ncbi:lipoyl synthase [Tumebacillus permanentifrigoris]|uniref:Lipoyl synthase n=1 Tax=Tumebacillus permanentifrigoris TaxID=378543 RepID=A0A316D2S5_9BACL|nr:lipoyl synthase [Tumebacillus permanentifrigoris]PWK05203.1 lipoic acid synthetase [Tumebacillus permanentifrigoris]
MEELNVLEEKPLRRPDWLKIQLKTGPNFTELKELMRGQTLHTVCEEARCPNIYECWENRTATFMILGDICTRACGFCAVKTGLPTELDLAEPERVAESVDAMGLRHAVVTAVARDDLQDHGASVFAETVRAIRHRRPQCTVEVLPSDMGGNEQALHTLLDAEPDIFNHNIETVRRLTPKVRAKATYDRTLEVLSRSKAYKPHIPTKSSLMLGHGETWEEIIQVMNDLRAVDCDIMTMGQYLQPTKKHLPVRKFWTPEEFAELKVEALKRGFKHVESGPLVRSSYHAHEQAQSAEQQIKQAK